MADQLVTVRLEKATPSTGGSFITRRFTLSRQNNRMSIGRSSKRQGNSERAFASASNAFFDSPIVSRKHAELFLEHGSRHVWIRDTDSLHGTLVNSHKLEPYIARQLGRGDLVSLGSAVSAHDQQFIPMEFRIYYDCSTPSLTSQPPQLIDLSSPTLGPTSPKSAWISPNNGPTSPTVLKSGPPSERISTASQTFETPRRSFEVPEPDSQDSLSEDISDLSHNEDSDDGSLSFIRSRNDSRPPEDDQGNTVDNPLSIDDDDEIPSSADSQAKHRGVNLPERVGDYLHDHPDHPIVPDESSAHNLDGASEPHAERFDLAENMGEGDNEDPPPESRSKESPPLSEIESSGEDKILTPSSSSEGESRSSPPAAGDDKDGGPAETLSYTSHAASFKAPNCCSKVPFTPALPGAAPLEYYMTDEYDQNITGFGPSEGSAAFRSDYGQQYHPLYPVSGITTGPNDPFGYSPSPRLSEQMARRVSNANGLCANAAQRRWPSTGNAIAGNPTSKWSPMSIPNLISNPNLDTLALNCGGKRKADHMTNTDSIHVKDSFLPAKSAAEPQTYGAPPTNMASERGSDIVQSTTNDTGEVSLKVLCITNLDPTICTSRLRGEFGGVSKVVKVNIKQNTDSEPGINQGYVEFETAEQALQTLKVKQGCYLAGRPANIIRVALSAAEEANRLSDKGSQTGTTEAQGKTCSADETTFEGPSKNEQQKSADEESQPPRKRVCFTPQSTGPPAPSCGLGLPRRSNVNRHVPKRSIGVSGLAKGFAAGAVFGGAAVVGLLVSLPESFF